MQQCSYGAIMSIDFHKLIISNKTQPTLKTVHKTVSVCHEIIILNA